jgi:hypothetical protein
VTISEAMRAVFALGFARIVAPVQKVRVVRESAHEATEDARDSPFE